MNDTGFRLPSARDGLVMAEQTEDASSCRCWGAMAEAGGRRLWAWVLDCDRKFYGGRGRGTAGSRGPGPAADQGRAGGQ